MENEPLDRRCWRYRPGEARIFATPDDVPQGEGWVDSPALVEAAPAPPPARKRGRPPKVRIEARDIDGDDDADGA